MVNGLKELVPQELLNLPNMLEAFSAALNRTGAALGEYAQPHHSQIRQLALIYASLPRPLLLVGHSLFVASLFRSPHMQRHWLLGFWVSFAAGFGGSTLANLMCNEPPAWFVDNSVLPTYFVCWWILMYSRRGVGFRIYQMLPVKASCHAACNVLRSRAVMAKVDVAVFMHGPHSFVAALFLGTLAGVGGRFLSDLSLGTVVCPEKRLSELASPSWSVRSAFGAALFFWATVHFLSILPRDVAETLVVTSCVARGLACDVLGRPLDPTYPFSALFHLLSGIPWPPSDEDARSMPAGPARFQNHHEDITSAKKRNALRREKKKGSSEKEKGQ